MQATLTSRRDHNFRVNNRKENLLYNNKLITCMKELSLWIYASTELSCEREGRSGKNNNEDEVA